MTTSEVRSIKIDAENLSNKNIAVVRSVYPPGIEDQLKDYDLAIRIDTMRRMLSMELAIGGSRHEIRLPLYGKHITSVDAICIPYQDYWVLLNENEYWKNDPEIQKFIQKFQRRGDRYCQYCKEVSPTAKLCSKCNSVYYCNRSCQSKDWSEHKFSCS